MSAPDEMGLTPDAALGYEQFFVPAIFHQWPDRIISAAAITDSDDVLDVGCGTGALTREVVACAGSVTGIDLSESILGVARQVCPTVTFQQGNVAELPFDNATFDAVVSAFMLKFVPDPKQAIGEMQRVLRPGGRIEQPEYGKDWATTRFMTPWWSRLVKWSMTSRQIQWLGRSRWVMLESLRIFSMSMD